MKNGRLLPVRVLCFLVSNLLYKIIDIVKSPSIKEWSNRGYVFWYAQEDANSRSFLFLASVSFSKLY